VYQIFFAYPSLLTQHRPSQISLVIAELAPAPQALAVVVTHLLIMIVEVVVHHTALVVMDTATEAPHHLAAMTMTMTVVDMVVLRPELVPQSMTTHLPAVVVSMIPIVATTLPLTRMLMAMVDLLHETTLPEIILPEMLVTLTMIVVVATGNQSCQSTLL
jgi:hypothetical protein